MGSIESLYRLADSVLLNSRVTDLEHPPRVDMSYMLNFQGPMLQCQEMKGIHLTTFQQNDFMPLTDELRNLKSREFKNPIQTYNLSSTSESLSLTALTSAVDLRYAPCNQTFPGMNESAPLDTMIRDVTLLWPTMNLECSAATARYSVNISFTRGIRSVTYSTTAMQSLPLMESEFKPGWSQSFKPLQSTEEYFSIMAIIESFLSNFDYQGINLTSLPFARTPWQPPPARETFHLLNGSDVVMDVCDPFKAICEVNRGKCD